MMPTSREYILAETSDHKIEDNFEEMIKEDLRSIEEPQTKKFWIRELISSGKITPKKAEQLFNRFILDQFLLFLRVYRGEAIYVNSTTPVWFHNKMPVIVLES